MKCNRCGKEIEEDTVYTAVGVVICKECNKEKSSISMEEVWNKIISLEKEDKILKFINDFKKSHQEALEDTFSNGYCFWFAQILEARFDGDLIYDPIQNHFATLINEKYYDIKGIAKGNFVLWEDYALKDILETSRIYRDCIWKDTCGDGREAHCESLQNSKTVGPNPTLRSKETYYKISEDDLLYLIRNELILRALEYGGVENWSWYDDSRSEFLDSFIDEHKIDKKDIDFGFDEAADIIIKEYDRIE